MGMKKTKYGTLEDGREVMIFTMKNRHGIEASVIEFGGRLTELILPDSHNQWSDVVFGYDNLFAFGNLHARNFDVVAYYFRILKT